VIALQAGVKSIMTRSVVFPRFDELPATLSRRFLTDLLRGELGYDGVVVTDALEMQAVADRWGVGGAAVRALAAGADALLLGAVDGERRYREVRAAVTAAVESAELPLARLEEAAERVRGLSEWAASPRRVDAEDGVGLEAARRAVDAEGPLPLPAA